MNSICLWCGKSIKKHKNSICQECAKKVINGTYDYQSIFKDFLKVKRNDGSEEIIRI